MKQEVKGKHPAIASNAYVHPNAVVIGDVVLGENANIWPGVVLRGDLKSIIVGKMTNIQDGCILHTSEFKIVLADMVTVEHRAVLHSCEIGKGSIVGIGAIILDAAKIGRNCIIEAGTLIPSGEVIPSGNVVKGNPYKIIRKTTDDEIEQNTQLCERYAELSKTYIRTGDIL
ncbi:MAG: gamma carbonic anhydrase family protein [Clostridia bacterium]|jgi:carbonic anhydrase/acetyltransferase-like protein (isoleucine patch superfamily)|nr:gamma carbonic anhydrase family protein [Clostridia bacterium]